MGPSLWKLEISNDSSNSGFLNVSEQQVWGGSKDSMHSKAGIQFWVFIKNPTQ